jgi:hypothetical protein
MVGAQLQARGTVDPRGCQQTRHIGFARYVHAVDKSLIAQIGTAAGLPHTACPQRMNQPLPMVKKPRRTNTLRKLIARRMGAASSP